jgi:predicted acyl esterase
VPVLLANGFWDDSGARIGAVMEWWRKLRGPRQAWFGQYAHVHATNVSVIGRDGYFEQALRLFDRELRDRPSPEPEPPVVVQEGPSGRWRAEDAWPPADTRSWAMPLRSGTYRDIPGNKAEAKTPEDGFAEAEPGVLAPLTGQGAWSVTGPLPREAHLAGIPRVRVRAAGPPGATAIALLYDVAPDGTAVLASRGVTRLRRDGTASVRLDDQDWRFDAGHRIGVLLTGSDDTAYFPVPRTLGEVSVQAGDLTLPLLTGPRDEFIAGDPGAFSANRRPIRVPAEAVANPVDATLP